MAAKEETPQQRSKRIREEVQGNIERVRTLRSEGNTAGVDDLVRETTDLISSLSRPTQAKLLQELKEAAETTASEGEVETYSTVDYKSVVPQADKVIKDTARKLHLLTSRQDKLFDEFHGIAGELFQHYLSMRLNGEPDIQANSQGARDIAGDMRRALLEHLVKDGLDQEAAEGRLEATWTTVKRHVTEHRAAYALSMDDDPERFRELFPSAAEAHPELRPSEALSMQYKVDLLGFYEKQRRRVRAGRLRRKADDLEAGPERDKLLQAAEELEQSIGKAPAALDPVRVTRSVNKKVGAAVSDLDPEAVRALPDSEKRVIAATYPTIIGKLSAALQAATEPPES